MAEEYELKDVAKSACDSIFHVKSSTAGVLYTTDLNIPCCTCQDFMRHKLPCKHFFAIFRFFSEWSFARLPKEYTEGPLLSLHRDIPAAPSDWDTPRTPDAGMDCDATEAAPTVAELPKTVREASMKSRRLITDGVHRIASIVMYCKDEDKKREAYQHIQQAYKILASGCPSSSSGLVIRGSPTKGCSNQATKCAARRLRLKALQQTRGHTESWKTRGRVGKRASEMRETVDVSP